MVARLIDQVEPVPATLCGTILVNGPGSHRDTARFTRTGSLIIYGALGMLGSRSLYWHPAKARLAQGDDGPIALARPARYQHSAYSAIHSDRLAPLFPAPL